MVLFKFCFFSLAWTFSFQGFCQLCLCHQSHPQASGGDGLKKGSSFEICLLMCVRAWVRCSHINLKCPLQTWWKKCRKQRSLGKAWKKHHIREEVGRGTEVSESRWSVVISCKINVNTSRKLLFLCSCQTEGTGAIKTIGKLF